MISRMYYYYSDPKEIDYVVIRIKSKFFRLQRMIYFLILIMSIGLNSFYVVRTFNKIRLRVLRYSMKQNHGTQGFINKSTGEYNGCI